ncbi:hypothetical protein BH23VER1_BH23VER1_20020 [soil metagenome]
MIDIALSRPRRDPEPHFLPILRSVAQVCGSRRILFVGNDEARIGRVRAVAAERASIFEAIGTADCRGDCAVRGTVVVCPGMPDTVGDVGALVAVLGELAAGADAVIVTATDRELAAYGGGRWSMAEFREAGFDRSGAEVLWGGLVYESGPVGGARDTMLLVVGRRDTALAKHLAGAPRSLLCDPLIADLAPEDIRSWPGARICIATNNITGMNRNGVGTAHASLATFLAGRGHEVTILFTGKHVEQTQMEAWTTFYREKGVTFVPLPEFPCAEYYDNLLASHQTYLWLAEHDRKMPFDVIHFTECQASGFHTLCAKRSGLGFRGTTLVVTPHGSLRWCVEGNFGHLSMLREFITDEIEFRSLEMADIVIGPSAYMLDWLVDRGARLPARQAVQQYLLPVPLSPGWSGGGEVREWVFFGRLERRKGLHFFLDALDQLGGELPDDFQVTFLGEHVPWSAEQSTPEYIRERAKGWTFQWQILDRLNQIEACDYIRGHGRLSIVASVQDNLPNTVIECLALGIEFVAARIGGIQELIAPGDLRRVTFEIGNDEAGLVELLRRIRRDGYGERPQFAVDPEETARCLDLWHRAAARRPPPVSRPPAVARGRLRVVAAPVDAAEALEVATSLRDQTYDDFFAEIFVASTHRSEILAALEGLNDGRIQTVLIDQGDELGATMGGRMEGEEAGATVVLGRGITLMPEALASLARVPGEIVTMGVAAKDPDEIPLVPVGGSPLLHCYGNVSAACFLVTREAALKIGGPYGADTDAVVSDFVVRASLAGIRWGSDPRFFAQGNGFRDFYEGLPWGPVGWIIAKVVKSLPPEMKVYGDWIVGLSEAVEDTRGHANRVMAHAERVQAHADRIEGRFDQAMAKVGKLKIRIETYQARLADRRDEIEKLKSKRRMGLGGLGVGRFLVRLGRSIKKRVGA